MTIILVCQKCGHSDTEHFYETIQYGEKVILPCGHDDYVDDGGERIHNFCKCKGFETRKPMVMKV